MIHYITDSTTLSDTENTLFITLSLFKNSSLPHLQKIKETTISEFPLFTDSKNILYLNVSNSHDNTCPTPLQLREKGKTLQKIAQKYCTPNIKNYVFTADTSLSEQDFSALIDGIHLGEYSFDTYKSKKTEQTPHIFIVSANQNILTKKTEREAWTTGIAFTKDMINTPPSLAIPSYIEEKTRELFASINNIKITSLLEKDLKKLGAEGILSVGQASPDQSRFLIIEYRNAPTTQKPIGLVGKGVTYDTGGLSLKPSQAMTGMKKDMGGAATIIGGLYTCAKMQLKKNIVAVIPLAENLLSEKSYKPDDIITMFNGTTVEITNTDAEGRLLLGDALAYIEKTFTPRILIDMATLTGACAYAIGEEISAVFSNNESLYTQLETSSKNTDEPIWRLPLYSGYKDKIKSKIADIVNAATGFKAGTIQAALFLNHFVHNTTPWAHFDIAYSSFDSKTHFATGQNVRLLYDFITNNPA